MPGKPTEQEDEYFARLEFERHGRLIRSWPRMRACSAASGGSSV